MNGRTHININVQKRLHPESDDSHVKKFSHTWRESKSRIVKPLSY